MVTISVLHFNNSVILLRLTDMKQQLLCVESFYLLCLATTSKATNTQNNIFGNSITRDEL